MSDKIRICLDAGHYGHKYNHSPVVPAYYESEMNWKLHLFLKAELEAYGIEVITTRPNQEGDLDLFSRGAKSKGCTLFISIHSNACATETNDYPIAICLLDDEKIEIDDESRHIGDMIIKVVQNVMGTTQAGRIGTRQSAEDRDRNGVLDDEYYGVLNGAKQVGTPGMIIEHSFHTNARSAQWLLDDANLKQLARAEGAALAAYYGIAGKKEGVTDAGYKEEEQTPSGPVTEKTTVLYRVQVGAFNTEKMVAMQKAALESKGIKARIINEDGRFKVQAGEGLYEVKANADALLQIVSNLRFDAFIKVIQPAAVGPKEITAGSTVTVLKNVTYTGKPFRVYYDKYDVITISGDRVVIGIGNVVTCAIRKENVALA